MQDNFSKNIMLYIALLVPVIGLALRIAPFIDEGLYAFILKFPEAMEHPFKITWCESSLKSILILMILYVMGIGIFYATKKNYRRGEEHGSAKWGDAQSINRKYREKHFEDNKLLTQNVRMGLDGHRHRRNLNVLVCGGSGAGKTRFYAKPNVMQANTSMVILDPKGRSSAIPDSCSEKKGMKSVFWI